MAGQPGAAAARASAAAGASYVDVQLRRETDEDSIWHRQLPGTLTGDVVGIIERAGPDTDPVRSLFMLKSVTGSRCWPGAPSTSHRPGRTSPS